MTAATAAAATAIAADKQSRLPVLLSVNVGLPKNVPWRGNTVHTGAWKHPVHGPAMARRRAS
jgi:hypothetical protein